MRRSRFLATAAVAGGLLVSPAAAAAQVAWDAPMLLAPGAPAGWGFHLVDPAGGDIGGMVNWRGNPAPVGLGIRGGLYEGRGDDLAIAGGVDVSGAIHRGTGETPLDIIWFAGAGAGFDDDILLSFPAGVAFGWSFAGDGVAFRPYVAPRLVLDAFLDDDDDGPGRRGDGDDDLDLSAAVEVGLDLAFDPAWAIRAAASFGDRDAVSIGLALTPGR